MHLKDATGLLPPFPPAPPSFYFDYAAATPVDHEALAQFQYWSTQAYGNPASLHPMGSHSALGVQWARAQVANAMGCSPLDIIFTSSATEAANLALRGLVAHPKRKRSKILYGATEHSCVTQTLKDVSTSFGIQCHPMAVDSQGQILPEATQDIDETVLAVVVMPINNETGIVQTHYNTLLQKARSVGALMVADGVQVLVRSPDGFGSWDYDLAFVSSAKVYGPRGVGALAIRSKTPKIRLSPHTTGGGQEGGLRGGSLNVPGIVAFGTAVCKHEKARSQRLAHYQACEDAFVKAVVHHWGDDVVIHGHGAPKAPGLVMMALRGINAMALKDACPQVCFSTGSACQSLQATASPVLMAMGVPLEMALASFRVSFGTPSTVEEAAMGAIALCQSAKALKVTSATWF